MIVVKFESENRRFEYEKDNMIMTVVDTYLVDKKDVPKIIENINRLNSQEEK